MKKPSQLIALCSIAALMAGCASTPLGPTVNAMPPQGKDFNQFAQEKDYCKSYATQQVQGQADEANTTGLLEGVGGTLLGAGLGAAIGGGQGAAIGAGAGALGGTAVGASSSGGKQRSIQQQYNDAYAQCMTSKGNQIQVPAPRVVYTQPQTTVIYAQPAPPPPTVYYVQPAPPPTAYVVPAR